MEDAPMIPPRRPHVFEAPPFEGGVFLFTCCKKMCHDAAPLITPNAWGHLRMTQTKLFYDSVDDAIATTIMAIGGYKKVAVELWPSMKMESAYARLKAC